MINRCTGYDYCLNEQDAKNVIKKHWLHVAMNRIRFDQRFYGAEAIFKESIIEIYPIMT